MASKSRSVFREYVEAALWALIITLFLRAFVIQAFRIPSASMEDTLLIGDFLFVNKFEYGPKIPFTHVRLPGLREPRRGDVIVFQFPNDPSTDFIKRCVATGGETVEITRSIPIRRCGPPASTIVTTTGRARCCPASCS
jgi:signal peptidase I